MVKIIFLFENVFSSKLFGVELRISRTEKQQMYLPVSVTNATVFSEEAPYTVQSVML